MCTEDPSFAEGPAARGENARRFAKWIAAEWGNREQAQSNPAMWSHIHVVFRPLPWDVLGAYAFYTESAYNFNLGLPYKTSVVRLEVDEDETLQLASYKLSNPQEFWMGAYEPQLIKDLSRADLRRLSNECNAVYTWDALRNKYNGGSKPGKGCRIRRGGTERETYLYSEFELTTESYSAWDLGRDLETDKRVWGPPAGAFEFVPVQRLDHFVPDEPTSDGAATSNVQVAATASQSD